MYVHSVKLVNFKSIGDYPENEIILEPNITAIIGRNESGKSNILDGLSLTKLSSKNGSAFDDANINRNSSFGSEVKYVVTLMPTSDDIELGIKDATTIILTKNNYEMSGGLLCSYLENVQPHVDAALELLGAANSNALQLNAPILNDYQRYHKELSKKNLMDIPVRTSALKFVKQNSEKIAEKKRVALKESIDKACDKWEELLKRIPVFFIRRAGKHLSSSYKYDEIVKILDAPNSYPDSMLSEFIRVADIKKEEFLLAAQSGASAPQESIRRKINRIVNEKINAPFNDFYQTERITLDLGFNGGTVSLVIQSNDGSALTLSERSNGLRWYLETFIDAQANNISGKNIVYLFDEPGTSLHVNAQRELLRLFSHLAHEGNQVVYTTHSPYMLNTEREGLHRIRAVIKSEDGYSRIYKSVYDSRITRDSQSDTLAPVINALGMNLQDTFGPAKDKINIVTEGMSDYIYLTTLARIIGINENKYVIIPSVGAANSVNICSILHGWGCKYVALFDYDEAGVESGGEFLEKNMLLEFGKQYCYVKDVEYEEIKKKTYKTDSYMIEDVVNRTEIERFCEETNTSKTLGKPLTAKLMCTAIEDGSFSLREESIEDFRVLFKRIGVL